MAAELAPGSVPRGPVASGLLRVGEALLRTPRPLAWSLVLLQAGLIWTLSALHDIGPDDGGVAWSIFGNLAHAPLFGFLALFLAAALLHGRAAAGVPPPALAISAVVLGLVLFYGLVDEWHQSRVPGREPSGLDVMTDGVGALCVLWIVSYLGRPRMSERGLCLRLLTCVLACLASASIASVA